MAKRFLTGLRLVNLTSDPATGSEGELYFNSASNHVGLYSNGQWKKISTSDPYLTIESASATYLTIASASATYQPLGSGGIGHSFSTASPSGVGIEGDIFYRLNSASTQIQEIWSYYQNSWKKYEDDVFISWKDFDNNTYKYYLANNFNWYLGNEALV